MAEKRIWWDSWAHFLHRFEMEKPTAFLLEAAGPLNILLAQLITLGQPFFSSPQSRDHWTALAEMLDSPEESKAFATFLKEENNL